MFSNIDLYLRSRWSYFYRILLTVYLVITCWYSEENYFSWIEYSVVTTIYVLLYLVFKKAGYSKLRTVSDFAFITFMLYGKDLSTYWNYFPVIFTLINSQNNSGKKNHLVGYLVAIPVILILEMKENLFEVFSYKNFDYRFIVPLLIVFLLDIFLRFRSKIKQLNEALFEIVDDFYGVAFYRAKTINIYSKLIEQLNTFKVIRRMKIRNISCFYIKKKEKLILVNSSKNVYEYHFPEEEKLIKELLDKKSADNYKIVIDGEEHKNTYFFEIKGKSRWYTFMVIYKTNIYNLGLTSFFSATILHEVILTPTFKHLARLFAIQREVSINRYKALKSVASKLDYVLKANEVMHFVKGSLNNIKSALTISELINQVKDAENRKFLEASFIRQRGYAQNDVQSIVERADFILEKSKNPFEAKNFNDIDAKTLLFHVRKRWQESFWIQDVIITGDKYLLETNMVNTDFEIIDLILINIFSNVNKYSGGREILEFNVTLKKITIIFSNLIKSNPKRKIQDLEKLIEYFNKKNRIEISKRKSHGFVHLRTYCDTLDIKSLMEIEEKRYSISLEFTFINNENTNI